MKKITISIIIIILLSILIGAYSYQKIEGDTIASHWDIDGEVNGYMSKFWGVFLFPIMLIGMCILFSIIPKIDPLKKNIKKFKKEYNIFVFSMILFLFYVFILTILANLKYNFNMTTMIMPAMGLLFFSIGILMKKAERNWFIGIRTPWTMSSDKVWKKTHLLASKIYKAVGIIIILGIFFQNYLIWIILVSAIGSAIYLVVYSYLEYNKIKSKN